MKILKSYYKTPSFLTGRCIVSLTILGLISCSDRNGKSLSEATNDPAGIYREYLYNIRRQKDSSFQVLTEHILQWQTVKDSVFRHFRNDTISHPHSNQREECIRLHDSIRIEFSRLALSKTRTYQELLALKGEFSPYNNDEELHHAAGEIRPFFNSLDNLPFHKGNKEQILAAYRMLLTRTIRNGIHSRNELITYITKEDAIFRAFLSHLHDFEGESMADITRGTEQLFADIPCRREKRDYLSGGYALFDDAHQPSPNTKYADLYRRCSEQKNQDLFASTCLYMDAYPPLYFTGRILYDIAFR